MAARSGARAISSAAKRALDRLHSLKTSAGSSGNGIIRRDELPNSLQAHKLDRTLGITRVGWPPELGDGHPLSPKTIPHGYHLLYFLPDAAPDELRADGAFDEFGLGEEFPRRMWAGGKIEWNDEEELMLDDWCDEKTQLGDIEVKQRKNGQEMILLELKKEFRNTHLLQGGHWVDEGGYDEDGEESLRTVPWSVRESRNWVYLPPAAKSDIRLLEMPRELDDFPEEKDAVHKIYHRHSIPTLFRFSALTFNAHQIHYNPEWAREVEGHPAPVVHGPLNVILMLNQWRQWRIEIGDCHNGVPEWLRDNWRDYSDLKVTRSPKSMVYTNMRPLYAGEKYLSYITQENKSLSSCKLTMKKGNGDIAVEATIDW